ncbi:MAG TPA: hypothetical protein PLR25_19355, partial [Planctomycetaceae bacterium]|nr:hypothetical protein [Planctomycetaceae bacterium]
TRNSTAEANGKRGLLPCDYSRPLVSIRGRGNLPPWVSHPRWADAQPLAESHSKTIDFTWP